MTPGQCRAARAWLGWSQGELAGKAGVSEATVRNFEAGKGMRTGTVARLRGAFEASGIGFTDDGTRLGVTARKGDVT